MGYPFGKKGWKIYDLETRNIFVSRDIIFHEEIFPFAKSQDYKGGATVKFGQQSNVFVEDDFVDFQRQQCGLSPVGCSDELGVEPGPRQNIGETRPP